MYLIISISGHLERPDSLVTAPVTLPSPVVTGTTPVVAGSSPEKHIHEGESRKINLDVKFTVQSLEQLHKQLMSSAKSENPQLLASNQSSDSSSEPTTSSQQQGSGPLNAEASRLSKVSSDSSHSEAQQKSSGDLLGMHCIVFHAVSFCVGVAYVVANLTFYHLKTRLCVS